MCGEVRGQLLRVCFLLTPWGCQGSNSGHELWWQVPLPIELLSWPKMPALKTLTKTLFLEVYSIKERHLFFLQGGSISVYLVLKFIPGTNGTVLASFTCQLYPTWGYEKRVSTTNAVDQVGQSEVRVCACLRVSVRAWSWLLRDVERPRLCRWHHPLGNGSTTVYPGSLAESEQGFMCLFSLLSTTDVMLDFPGLAFPQSWAITWN